METALAAPSPAARPAADPPVHHALRRFMHDTLMRVGALDVTRRLELDCTVNLVQRLLEVLGEPAPDLHATMHTLRHAGASERRAQAAQLYRELAALLAAQPAMALRGAATGSFRRWPDHADTEH